MTGQEIIGRQFRAGNIALEAQGETPRAQGEIWTRNLITARGLNVRYGCREVLRDVYFSVPDSSITAMIGPSGCGKTTLLNCFNRLVDLIPSCSVSGQLNLGNQDLLDRRLDVIMLRRRVGMVFQRPNPFPFSIRRNLEFALRVKGCKSRGRIDEGIEACLSAVGLWDEVKDRLDRSAVSLSGGQQQRLCIARALLLEPEVLLFDEPCSALDPVSSTVVEEMIVSLRGRCTIVIVTHNLAQARRISDYCALFWVKDGTGCILETGPTRRLFEAPQQEITAAYIRGSIA
jgi:phosphate transport system ATP-binding protein